MLDEVTGRRVSPAGLYLGQRLCIHCTAGCVGPRNGLDGREKSHSHRDSIPEPSSSYRVAIPTTLSEGNTKIRLTLQTPRGYYAYMYQQVQHLEFLHSAHGSCLCFLYGSQNKQRLFPGVTWTDRLLLCGQCVYLRYEVNLYIWFWLIFVFTRPCHGWEDGCSPVTFGAQIRA